MSRLKLTCGSIRVFQLVTSEGPVCVRRYIKMIVTSSLAQPVPDFNLINARLLTLVDRAP